MSCKLKGETENKYLKCADNVIIQTMLYLDFDNVCLLSEFHRLIGEGSLALGQTAEERMGEGADASAI
jgi:hypothetical protein